MPLHPKPYLSPADYLAIERSSEFKSEYFNSEIFAMRGASGPYNVIVLSIRLICWNWIIGRTLSSTLTE